MDLRVKVKSVGNILNFIATYVNQPSKPKSKVYKQLKTLYKYYETKYDSVSSSAITPCAFRNNSLFMQVVRRNR